MSQGLATPQALQSLSKDHLLKEGMPSSAYLRVIGSNTATDLALNFVATVFKAYLKEQSIDHLLTTLKRGGIKDVVVFFPNNKRTAAAVEGHFKSNDLPQIAEWYGKRKTAAAKENITQGLKEMLENDPPAEVSALGMLARHVLIIGLQIIKFLKQAQTESTMPEGDFLQVVWLGLMSSVDWSAKADQIDATAAKEVANFAPILEPFCTNARTQVSLIKPSKCTATTTPGS
jgi:hypothetical protein